MTKVIIIDDEPLARSVVVEYLSHYPQFQIVEECSNGFEGFKSINLHKPDLIFLDIQMPKISGFEMIELLDPIPNTIFTTAFDEFALKAFDSNAIDYLLKPFSKDRFDKAIQKYLAANESEQSEANEKLLKIQENNAPENPQRIVVKVNNAIKIIPIQDIQYLEAYDDYIKIHTKEGFFLKKKTMNQYETLLSKKDFCRIHRSYLLNIQHLTKIEIFEKDSYCAILKSGEKLICSRTGYLKLKDLLGV